MDLGDILTKEQIITDLWAVDRWQAIDELINNLVATGKIGPENQEAIAAVLNGERWVDLPPGPSLVRRLEHEMARQAELISHSYGKEPRRHVRIFRE